MFVIDTDCDHGSQYQPLKDKYKLKPAVPLLGLYFIGIFIFPQLILLIYSFYSIENELYSQPIWIQLLQLIWIFINLCLWLIMRYYFVNKCLSQSYVATIFIWISEGCPSSNNQNKIYHPSVNASYHSAMLTRRIFANVITPLITWNIITLYGFNPYIVIINVAYQIIEITVLFVIDIQEMDYGIIIEKILKIIACICHFNCCICWNINSIDD